MSKDARSRYFALMKDRPDLFRNPPGQIIRILSNVDEIQRIEDEKSRKMKSHGFSPQWATVGVVFEDEYILIFRDAVEFPDRSTGTYIRIIPKGYGEGAAVLLGTADSILLERQFRHATRSWHWEIPRGFGSDGETPDQTAIRELSEEIGTNVESVEYIGRIHTDTGLCAMAVSLYIARFSGNMEFVPNEGISSVVLVKWTDALAMIAMQEITDSFTIAAISCAALKGRFGLTLTWKPQ